MSASNICSDILLSHCSTGSKCKSILANRAGNFPQRGEDFPGVGWGGGPPTDHLDGPWRGRWPRVPAAYRRDRAHGLPDVLHLGREAGLAHFLPDQPGHCNQGFGSHQVASPGKGRDGGLARSGG